MKPLSQAARLGALVFAIAANASSLVRANGMEFFDPGANAKVDLAYVGRVRDIHGRFLKGAEVVIWSPEAGLTFPAVTDMYGHYRTPDVGASLKEVAVAVNPKELQVACGLPGYELTRPAKIPNKTKGRVIIDFVLRPAGSAEQAASVSEERQSHRLLWVVPAFLVFVVIGAAVRT